MIVVTRESLFLFQTPPHPLTDVDTAAVVAVAVVVAVVVVADVGVLISITSLSHILEGVCSPIIDARRERSSVPKFERKDASELEGTESAVPLDAVRSE